MPTICERIEVICERIEGCDGGVCWYAPYRETDEGYGGGWCVSYQNAEDPYIEVQFDNLCLDPGIEIRVRWRAHAR